MPQLLQNLHILKNKVGEQKYFNIVLVLKDKWLTIFTRPAKTIKSV